MVAVSRNVPMIWGLDVSQRRTGIAYGYAGDTPTVVSIASHEGDDTARSGTRLFVYLKDLRHVSPPDAIYYERMLEHGFQADVAPNGQFIKQRRGILAAFAMARMTFAVELFASLASVPVRDVACNTTRKHFLGDGRLDRKSAKRRALAMCQVLSWPANNDDEADACGVFCYGSALSAPHAATVIHPGLFAKAATLADNLPRGKAR